MKTAIILFNLGGPDNADSIKPFLKNFFMDKAIIPAPRPFRDLISSLIANKRSRAEAGDSYGEMGGSSPLLKNTNVQADALQKTLGKDFKVFTCMRYWHPMAPEVVQDVKAYNPDKIILLPLYPQLSTTTTSSSYDEWMKHAKKAGLKSQTLKCCYPINEGFIKASADNIKLKYDEMVASGHAPRVLFSAHGVPLFVLKRGDPYQWQCTQTVKAIVEKLGIKGLDWAECYQSRVGPTKWTTPSVEDELKRAAHDNMPVLLYPHAFVSEHVETLVELDIEYKEIADHLGIPAYGRAHTVSTHPDFIGGLKDIVLETLKSDNDIYGAGKDGQSICPPEFKACACRANGKKT